MTILTNWSLYRWYIVTEYIQTGPNGSRSSCDVGKVCEGVCNAGSIRVMNLETERVKLRNIRFKDFKHICDYSKYSLYYIDHVQRCQRYTEIIIWKLKRINKLKPKLIVLNSGKILDLLVDWHANGIFYVVIF